jgi:hypothetical protein
MRPRMFAVISLCALSLACDSRTQLTTAPTRPTESPVVQAHVVAIYDLTSIGGRSLPQTYSGGGTSWQITGGHYELFDDGTYLWGYDYSGVTRWSLRPLPYTRNGSTLTFYLDNAAAPESQFYAGNHYLFSTGTLSGGAMAVAYTDPIDFEAETYSLHQ